MASDEQGAGDLPGLKELKMDGDRLYTEEVITDLAAGTIRRMTPLKADGSPDPSRPVLYMGHAQVMSSVGPLPIQFELAVDNLEAAVAEFGPAAEAAVRRMLDELRELQREQASQIVVPGAGGGGGPMPPPPAGGRFRL